MKPKCFPQRRAGFLPTTRRAALLYKHRRQPEWNIEPGLSSLLTTNGGTPPVRPQQNAHPDCREVG